MDYVAVHVFLTARHKFWDDHGIPIPFSLRPKRNTQDDPFDEFLANEVFAALPGITCARSPGPLITPDMVLFRSPHGADPAIARSTQARMLAIEVKKLERTAQGAVARASGLDYNTTPPCGTVRVYDKADRPVDIRCFYLFACLEAAEKSMVRLTALVLADGNLLNADFQFYLSIVGERTKQIGLGTYGDGANRARPMLIFSNPLGIRELDHKATLVHQAADLDSQFSSLVGTYSLVRTAGSKPALFYGYQFVGDVRRGSKVTQLVDPFPVPERVEQTQPRGRFRLPFEVRS